MRMKPRGAITGLSGINNRGSAGPATYNVDAHDTITLNEDASFVDPPENIPYKTTFSDLFDKHAYCFEVHNSEMYTHKYNMVGVTEIAPGSTYKISLDAPPNDLFADDNVILKNSTKFVKWRVDTIIGPDVTVAVTDDPDAPIFTGTEQMYGVLLDQIPASNNSEVYVIKAIHPDNMYFVVFDAAMKYVNNGAGAEGIDMNNNYFDLVALGISTITTDNIGILISYNITEPMAHDVHLALNVGEDGDVIRVKSSDDITGHIQFLDHDTNVSNGEEYIGYNSGEKLLAIFANPAANVQIYTRWTDYPGSKFAGTIAGTWEFTNLLGNGPVGGNIRSWIRAFAISWDGIKNVTLADNDPQLYRMGQYFVDTYPGHPGWGAG